MRVVVTGAAGFIGSTLTDALLARGHDVLGVDCFTSDYDPATKRGNVAAALDSPMFELVEADVRSADLAPLLDGADVVFHEAARPGVRLSWADEFSEYDSINVLGTQRVLEAARSVGVGRLVYASSSSVYGNASRYPTLEKDVPSPHSPYGVTKLAGEHLCQLYAQNWALPTVSLRYFTVYGPRQRPDMAIHRLLRAALTGEPFPLYGDGSQRRDFTFVTDIVDASLRAAIADIAPGSVCNLAGGKTVAMTDLISLAGRVVGHDIDIDRRPPQPGDVHETGGSIERAHDLLGWRPRTGLQEGLHAQLAWHRNVDAP